MFPACSDAAIKDGLDWVMSEVLSGRQIRVLNMSLGGPSPVFGADFFLQTLHDLGVVEVASAGNDGLAPIVWPARSQYVTAVGGVDPFGNRHPLSSFGADLDVVAPFQTWSLDANGNAWYFTGTSAAAPVISGLAALYASGTFYPDLFSVDMFSTHRSNWNEQLGNGIPNGLLVNMWYAACSIFDFSGDRVVDVTDGQMISYRYAGFYGDLRYQRRFDLDPMPSEGNYFWGDLDIDISDLQRVFGRFWFSCPS
jgi:hypothetical protein